MSVHENAGTEEDGGEVKRYQDVHPHFIMNAVDAANMMFTVAIDAVDIDEDDRAILSLSATALNLFMTRMSKKYDHERAAEIGVTVGVGKEVMDEVNNCTDYKELFSRYITEHQIEEIDVKAEQEKAKKYFEANTPPAFDEVPRSLEELVEMIKASAKSDA